MKVLTAGSWALLLVVTLAACQKPVQTQTFGETLAWCRAAARQGCGAGRIQGVSVHEKEKTCSFECFTADDVAVQSDAAPSP
jgi:hypothetical protein